MPQPGGEAPKQGIKPVMGFSGDSLGSGDPLDDVELPSNWRVRGLLVEGREVNVLEARSHMENLNTNSEKALDGQGTGMRDIVRGHLLQMQGRLERDVERYHREAVATLRRENRELRTRLLRHGEEIPALDDPEARTGNDGADGTASASSDCVRAEPSPITSSGGACNASAEEAILACPVVLRRLADEQDAALKALFGELPSQASPRDDLACSMSPLGPRPPALDPDLIEIPEVPAADTAAKPRSSMPAEGPHAGSCGADYLPPDATQDTLQITTTISKSFVHGDSREVQPRNVVERMVMHTWFEVTFAGMIVANAIVMATEVQYNGDTIGASLFPVKSAQELWPYADDWFSVLDWVFGIAFAVEVLLKMLGTRDRWYKDWWNVIDFVIVALWTISVGGASIGMNTNFARLARLSRLGRLARLVRTIEGFDAMFLMTTSIKGSIGVLGWAFVLIAVVLTFEALLIWQCLQTWYEDESKPLEVRQQVFRYFGTYTRALFSMFELTLANWPPAGRLLAESVSEWFMLIVVFHKLIIGFAVIGVINGVFIQETFRVAAIDNTLMVRNKQRQVKAHKSKMTALFAAADLDHDGCLKYTEFKQVFTEPDLKLWMAAMDLNTDDVPLLYTLLDDGDGTGGDGVVSIEELIKGVSRLRGTARSIDLIHLMREVREMKEKLLHPAKQLPPAETLPLPRGMVSLGPA